MVLRILSVIAVVVLIGVALNLFESRAVGVEERDKVTAGLRLLAPIGLALAAALTVLAQFKTPPVVILIGGVALVGSALAIQPNLAIWVGLLGDGLFSPMRSGSDALLVGGAGLWLLLLFGAVREPAVA